MRHLKLGSALAVLFTLAGCVSVGSPFPSRVDWIKTEITSKDDVKMVLGSPYAAGSASGRETWTYSYSEWALFQGTQHKELKIYWKPNGKVETFSFNSSFPKDIGESHIDAVSKKNGANNSAVTR